MIAYPGDLRPGSPRVGGGGEGGAVYHVPPRARVNCVPRWFRVGCPNRGTSVRCEIWCCSGVTAVLLRHLVP